LKITFKHSKKAIIPKRYPKLIAWGWEINPKRQEDVLGYLSNFRNIVHRFQIPVMYIISREKLDSLGIV
jgi:hypothetical protein